MIRIERYGFCRWWIPRNITVLWYIRIISGHLPSSFLLYGRFYSPQYNEKAPSRRDNSSLFVNRSKVQAWQSHSISLLLHQDICNVHTPLSSKQCHDCFFSVLVQIAGHLSLLFCGILTSIKDEARQLMGLCIFVGSLCSHHHQGYLFPTYCCPVPFWHWSECL